MKEIGYGADYKYAHSYEGNFALQEYLPEGISESKLYDPGENQREADIRKRLREQWKKYNY